MFNLLIIELKFSLPCFKTTALRMSFIVVIDEILYLLYTHIPFANPCLLFFVELKVDSLEQSLYNKHIINLLF